MTGQPAEQEMRDSAMALVALVLVEGTAAHDYPGSVFEGSDTNRNASDAIHQLCTLHGRHPGVVDEAAARIPHADARAALNRAAEGFVIERDLLARLVVAAGPLPSTPGQAEAEATVIAQHHAIDQLARSDRTGCAIGAALALILDWRAVRAVLDQAAKRFGIDARRPDLPDTDEIVRIARLSCPEPAAQRALLFGAEQIVAQHRGLWTLLEARAHARAQL